MSKPWLKALSGLSINISAAWFVVPFIGPSVSFPNSIWDFLVLIGNISLGIIFLLISVKLEEEIIR